MTASDTVSRHRCKGGDEWDHFAKRGYYAQKAWRSGVRRLTKAKFNRRMRRELKLIDRRESI